MPSTWPQVIRDPVHNLITFENNDIDRLLLNLINAKEFQRLRRIKQLGLCEMVFPGANHNRFAHSIGVMHVARQMLAKIIADDEIEVTGEQKTIVTVAALLHDIGHGPFSHAFEKVTTDKHESRTLQIILDPETEINRTLREINENLPNKVSEFFNEDVDENSDGAPSILTQIVSSQLDADRADYLLRDSHATGA